MLKLISRHLCSNAAQSNLPCVDGCLSWQFPVRVSAFEGRRFSLCVCVCVCGNCDDFYCIKRLLYSCGGYSEPVRCLLSLVFLPLCFSVSVTEKYKHSDHRSFGYPSFSHCCASGLTYLVLPRLSLMSHPTRQRCFMLTNPDRFTICPATTCIFSAHTATLTFPAIIVSAASKRKRKKKKQMIRYLTCFLSSLKGPIIW